MSNVDAFPAGFSIFVVFGEFPECEADNLLRLVPAVRAEKPRSTVQRQDGPTAGASGFLSEGQRLGGSTSAGQRAGGPATDPDDDAELQRALRLSLGHEQDDEAETPSPADEAPDVELRKTLRFAKEPSTSSQDDDLDLQKALCLSLENGGRAAETSEDIELEKALRMSLECESSRQSLSWK